ncbi:MAG: lipopolysaccharide heptosyltransferase I [Campylobacter sp.]|nr:lipopolysaccharide heptosyltransferase I [Campylobacter sp.]
MVVQICIVKLSAFGDIVHASIILQFIKANIKDAQISWVCEERFSDLLQSHELIDTLITLNLKEGKFKNSLKALKNSPKFDIVIDMQGLIKSAIISRILSKNVVGFDRKSIRESAASLLYKRKISSNYSTNIVLRNLTLVSKALNFSFNQSEILNKQICFKYKYDKSSNLELSCDKKRILIAVGSSIKAKIYPQDNQIKLINSLSQYEIWLLAIGEFEENLAKNLANKTKAKILPTMSLSEFASNISKFDLVIGGDTGPTHLAWAQNTPSITLFGYTPHYRNAYITKQNLVLDSGKNIDALNLNKNDYCIAEISPETIALKAKDLLSG